MNHQEAVDRDAVGKYLLGELAGTECDEFESHFFDCAECAAELRAGALFEENAKAVFREEGKGAAGVPWWRSIWQQPWSAAPALAAIVLLGVCVYQASVIIPALRGQLRETLAPQPIASYVLPSLARGDERVLTIGNDNRFYALYMDPTWQGSFKEYVCSFEDQSGAARFVVRIPAPAPGKPIQVLLSRNQLPAGRYTVIVRNAAAAGQTETELERYSLILKTD